MAEHQNRFADIVIAEMRGISDEQGRSPFWTWLEEHFFSLDFPTADYLTGIGKKGFIAELMPKYPIYVSLLSEAAQNAIGKVHEKTKPALRLLEQEGFKCRGYVDIFDAGPTVEADVKHIATVQASRKASVVINDNLAQTDGDTSFVINTSVTDFRAIIAEIAYVDSNRVAIEAEAAKALNIKDGDSIRFSPANTKH
jgi:arginine N-succinyltransferase